MRLNHQVFPVSFILMLFFFTLLSTVNHSACLVICRTLSFHCYYIYLLFCRLFFFSGTEICGSCRRVSACLFLVQTSRAAASFCLIILLQSCHFSGPQLSKEAAEPRRTFSGPPANYCPANRVRRMATRSLDGCSSQKAFRSVSQLVSPACPSSFFTALSNPAAFPLQPAF